MLVAYLASSVSRYRSEVSKDLQNKIINLEKSKIKKDICRNKKGGKMIQMTLTRMKDNGVQTHGILAVEGTTKVYATLELPWRHNRKRLSCIPKGEYTVQPRYSEKFGLHLEILNVKDRSHILIHKGNYYGDTAGCILVGKGWKDINNDGEQDVIRSQEAIFELTDIITKPTQLTIK